MTYKAQAMLFDKEGKRLLVSDGTGNTLGDAASWAIDLLLARSNPLSQFARIVVETERLPANGVDAGGRQ